MNLDERGARALVSHLVGLVPFDRVDAVVAPAFPFLRAVLDAAAGTPLAVAAQNIHGEERGAFTGEVSAAMLVEMGVGLVIVGHSERRTLFGESDDDVARKVSAARRHGLVPIVCVGETEAERESGRTRDVIVRQVEAAFVDRAHDAAGGVVVAYEPVWAIGTGRTPQARDVAEAHAAIRETLADRWGPASAGMPVLYGGSVTPSNAATLLRAPGVGGALVGGASLDAASFAAIASATIPA